MSRQQAPSHCTVQVSLAVPFSCRHPHASGQSNHRPCPCFPKASLTRRILPANNMMRMAKSWGHNGRPVPAPHGRQTEMRWQCTKRLSALSPQHCSAAEVAAIMRVSFTQRRTNVISAHERYFTNSRRFLSDAAPRQRPAGTPPVATPTGLPAQCCSGR